MSVIQNYERLCLQNLIVKDHLNVYGTANFRKDVNFTGDVTFNNKNTQFNGPITANVLKVNTITSPDGDAVQVEVPLQTVNAAYKSNILTTEDVTRRSENGNVPERYDIIICGAGTSGSLLCYRLAEQYPTAKILVLEAGKDDIQDDAVIRTPQDGPNPNQYDANPFITDDWGQLIRSTLAGFGEGAFTIQQMQRSTVNDQYIPQQKILAQQRGVTFGGTSAINYALWNRGTKQGTYDKWEVATGSSEYGWTTMNESFKTLENRSQQTRYYGQPIPLWLPPATPAVPPSAKFDPATQGDQGRINLYQPVLPGYTNDAVIEIAASGFGGRSLAVNLNAEDPNNPSEYGSPIPTTQYSQSNPDFETFNPLFPNNFNPYPASTPGLTYTPPNPLGTIRGPQFAGVPAKLDGVPVILGQANLKKTLNARCFGAPAFMYPLIYPIGNPDLPNNVTIKTKAYVTKLIFSESNPTECIGVEYVENGWHVANVARAIKRDVKPWVNTYSDVDRSLCTEEQAVINQAVALSGGIQKAYAKTDVWLCMGAIDSPAILQRSGIGPKELLESLNYAPVKCIFDLPGVGRGLQDTCDTATFCFNEVDFNTYLPAYTGAPASTSASGYADVFGLADPADPTDAFGSSSISGAATGVVLERSRLRVKSKPSKAKFDFDLLVDEFSAIAPIGNILWGDMASIFQNDYFTLLLDSKLSYANYDRSKIGQYDGNGTLIYVPTFLVFSEFWDVQSKGEVSITSSNVFDRPNYAPNMLSNENDLEAYENHFENNILPLMTKLASKKRGPRGPFSYASVIGAGGHIATTTDVQLSASVAASLFKPFAPAYVISQANYDTAGGDMLGASLSMVSGAANIPGNNLRTIIAWSGNTGNPLTSYVATVNSPYGGLPVALDQYELSLATELPLDSVEFNGDNNRNFARFLHPNGDNIYSNIYVQDLTLNPLTTTAGSTRVSVYCQAHDLAVGEMIKISGVSGPVDTIAASEFNEYHVVDAVLDSDNFQIVLFWNKTARPGLPGSPAYPNPAAGAVGIVGTGGSGIRVHTLKFDRIKFREYLQHGYSSGWHAGSSCRMGVPTDSQAVVDTRARVYNTLGLRVCDTSIFPTKPDGNTQAPAYGIAQRIFELVSSEEYDNLL